MRSRIRVARLAAPASPDPTTAAILASLPPLILAATLLLTVGGCNMAVPPPPGPSPNGGVRALDAARALSDPDDESAGTDNTGTWGGVQVPNIQDAPRLPLPPSRVPGL